MLNKHTGNDDHGDSDSDDQAWPDVKAADCDLLGGVDISGLPGHEVQETIELHVAGGVGVHNRQDTLEVNLALGEGGSEGEQRAEGRGQRAEGRGQRAEGREQRAESSTWL